MAEERTGDADMAGELPADQELVLGVLQDSGGPMDVIALSSRTRLSVERVLDALKGLQEQDLVERRDPEPVHERFASAGLQPA